MKNLVGKGIGFIDEAVEQVQNYYGTKTCGLCMFYDEGGSDELPHCRYRAWLREEHGTEPSKDCGREPEEEIFPTTPGCKVWFD